LAKHLTLTHIIEAPEGIELDYQIASPVVRAQAWLYDVLIRAAIYLVFGIALGMGGGFTMGIYLIIIFLLEWFYPVFFEVLKYGATPGKRAVGIRVINIDGTPVNWPNSMLRNLLRTIDFMPLLNGLGLLTCLLNSKMQRLGDLAAGTLVVYSAKTNKNEPIDYPAPVATPPLPLRLEEQQAILDYAARLPNWSEARQLELAGILEEVTQSPQREGQERLIGYAKWIQGQHH